MDLNKILQKNLYKMLYINVLQSQKRSLKIQQNNLKVYKKIAWDTDIWVAEDETHMTHKNGDKFIGRKLDGNN